MKLRKRVLIGISMVLIMSNLTTTVFAKNISPETTTPYTTKEKSVIGNNSGNLMNEGKVAESGEWIFYIADHLYKVKKDGTGKQKLANLTFPRFTRYLNVVGDTLYMMECTAENFPITSSLVQMKTDGSNKKALISNFDRCLMLQAVDSKLYFTGSMYGTYEDVFQKYDGTWSYDVQTGLINCIWINGLKPHIVKKEYNYFAISTRQGSTSLGSPIKLNFQLARDDGYTYRELNTDSLNYRYSGALVIGFPVMDVSNKYIYYGTTDGTIKRCDLDGGNPVVLAKRRIQNLIFQDGYIYYREANTGDVYRAKSNGKEEQKLVTKFLKGDTEFATFYVGSNAVYYIQNNVLYRVDASTGKTAKY